MRLKFDHTSCAQGDFVMHTYLDFWYAPVFSSSSGVFFWAERLRLRALGKEGGDI